MRHGMTCFSVLFVLEVSAANANVNEDRHVLEVIVYGKFASISTGRPPVPKCMKLKNTAKSGGGPGICPIYTLGPGSHPSQNA